MAGICPRPAEAGTIFIACFLFALLRREQYNLKLANSNQLVSEQVYCELHVAFAARGRLDVLIASISFYPVRKGERSGYNNNSSRLFYNCDSLYYVCNNDLQSAIQKVEMNLPVP